jgi:hypothetical protein
MIFLEHPKVLGRNGTNSTFITFLGRPKFPTSPENVSKHLEKNESF